MPRCQLALPGAIAWVASQLGAIQQLLQKHKDLKGSQVISIVSYCSKGTVFLASTTLDERSSGFAQLCESMTMHSPQQYVHVKDSTVEVFQTLTVFSMIHCVSLGFSGDWGLHVRCCTE